MRNPSIIALFLLTGGAACVAAQAGPPAPEIKVRRLSPRAAVFDLGAPDFTTAVVALAAQKGLVVIEAPGNPSVGKAVREAIQEEFRRSDFAWLLNTHEHHTGGNAAFADAPIAGHESVRTLMLAAAAQAPPNVTFDRQMTLFLGDMTVRLIYYGNAHTPADTFISIPEENLVVTGSVFFPGRVPMLGEKGQPVPNGKAGPSAQPPPQVVENWLAILRGLVADADDRTQFIPGHGRETMNKAYMVQTLAYLERLWREVRRAKAEGKTLEQVKTALTLKERFPEVAGRQDDLWEYRGLHQYNIEFLWRTLGN